MAEQAARAYLFWGDDALSRAEAVGSFKSRMLALPTGEMNVSEFEAPELSAGEVIRACDTAPFLEDRRLVIVHDLFSWRPRTGWRRRAPSGETSEDETGNALKAERDAFVAYLPRLAPKTTLILNEGSLDPARRLELMKQLPATRVDAKAFPAPRGPDLERWLAGRAARRGGELGPRVAALLREHGPSRLEALDQEVAKLVAYAGGKPASAADLQELLPGAEIVVFDLLDALAEGRSSDALTTLRRLYQQGQRAEELSSQIMALYRRLLVCRLVVEERADPAQVERTQRVKLIDKLKRQARNLAVERILAGLQALLEFDRKLKRGEVDSEAGLEVLVAELAETNRPRRPDLDRQPLKTP